MDISISSTKESERERRQRIDREVNIQTETMFLKKLNTRTKKQTKQTEKLTDL